MSKIIEPAIVQSGIIVSPNKSQNNLLAFFIGLLFPLLIFIIKIKQIHESNNKGKMLGVVKLHKALEIAENAGLDLVEGSPNAKPPVCKILDHGKFKFEAQKKAAKARKKQKVIDIKEVKYRPNIDTNDFNIKTKNVIKFLSSGDKVKITLRYRGREMAHRDLGINVLKKIKEETVSIAKVELEPKLEGRQAVMILAPEDKTKKKYINKYNLI